MQKLILVIAFNHAKHPQLCLRACKNSKSANKVKSLHIQHPKQTSPNIFQVLSINSKGQNNAQLMSYCSHRILVLKVGVKITQICSLYCTVRTSLRSKFTPFDEDLPILRIMQALHQKKSSIAFEADQSSVSIQHAHKIWQACKVWCWFCVGSLAMVAQEAHRLLL